MQCKARSVKTVPAWAWKTGLNASAALFCVRSFAEVQMSARDGVRVLVPRRMRAVAAVSRRDMAGKLGIAGLPRDWSQEIKKLDDVKQGK
jgi:hypothetical protein